MSTTPETDAATSGIICKIDDAISLCRSLERERDRFLSAQLSPSVQVSDLCDALRPILDWYVSDEHPEPAPIDIVRSVVDDLQSDRKDALEVNRLRERVAALEREHGALKEHVAAMSRREERGRNESVRASHLLPTRDSDLVAWLSDFASLLESHGCEDNSDSSRIRAAAERIEELERGSGTPTVNANLVGCLESAMIENRRLIDALKWIEGCEDLKSARETAQHAGICAGRLDTGSEGAT